MNKERLVFVHGAGAAGAAAWKKQHSLSSQYDSLFVKRHGFDPATAAQKQDFSRDVEIVRESLEFGDSQQNAHVIAHAEGAVAAMMTALEYPHLLRSLVLIEPACFSLTRGLPATEAHIELSLKERSTPGQSCVWDAPLDIVPGVPTLVLTGAWEPLYEEVAQYLVSSGAVHQKCDGAHRPHDTAQGDSIIREFLKNSSHS